MKIKKILFINMSTVIQKLTELNELLKSGIITQQDFDNQKEKLLNQAHMLPAGASQPNIVINNSSTATATASGNNNGSQQKSKMVSLLLCIFLGWIGVHRFYTGHLIVGIIYACTFGLLGIGMLFDLLYIILGSYKDANGNVLK